MRPEYRPIKELFSEERLKEESIVELVNFDNEDITRRNLVRVVSAGPNNANMSLSFPFNGDGSNKSIAYLFTIWPKGEIINPKTGVVEKNFYSHYRVVEVAEEVR